MSLYLGTSPIANAGYDKADTDLSNLNSTGKNIANWSNNVTNCITEIPQDIKVELNNGTLTLKAGSKVYVPNGAGVFTEITISSDISGAPSVGTATALLFVSAGGTSLQWRVVGSCGSGTTDAGTTGTTFYNTSSNQIIAHNSGGNVQVSFPLCEFNSTSGTVTAINQVFNGFGYIGSTVFALPGVKGLIPNGRNEDGTLKNIELSLSAVVQSQVNRTYNLKFAITSSGIGVYYYDYDDINNYVYRTDTGARYYDRIICGDIVINNGVITSLTPKTAFHALDYNGSSTISGWAMPSSRYIDLTLGASGATYTAPANGWVFFQDTANQPYSALVLRTNYIRVSLTPGTNGNPIMSEIMPVKKGDIFYAEYANITGENRLFRFIYAEGEN